MKVRGPDPLPRKSGDYEFYVTAGYGDPTGTIWLDEDRTLELDWLNAADCDRLVKAATEVRAKVLAYRAQMAVPHGTRHFHEGTCQLCGKPADVADALHGEPRQEPGGRCAVAGCRHPKASHWEHNPASGGRVGCAILGCRCEAYADPAEPERSAAPVIAPCPAAVMHGPCSRLAGHPVPHRTLAGHEWDDSLCARPGCGHSERDHVFGLQPSMVTRECGDADCGCAAFEAPDAMPESPVGFTCRCGHHAAEHSNIESGECLADGCGCERLTPAEVTGSQERDGSRVAR